MNKSLPPSLPAVPTGAMDEPRAESAPKRVVIVDDSGILRAWLQVVLESDPRLKVVGMAANAEDARRVIKEVTPDVITLDVEMPGMNGLAFLDKLMQLRPMPVVMFSGATRNNSEATVTALLYGAVDCLTKPTTVLDAAGRLQLVDRILAAADSRVPARSPQARPMPPRAVPGADDRTGAVSGSGAAPAASPAPRPVAPPAAQPDPLVLVGASTGGVTALEVLLAGLDPKGAPVVIVQHMPDPYLISFSRMLDRHLPQDVGLLQDRQPLTAGQVRLAPGLGADAVVRREGGQWLGLLTPGDGTALHCPSVHQLFASAYPHARDVIAVMLTGLGKDGAEAMAALRAKGARTIGQDAETSTVYGMPRAAFDLGAVQTQLPLAAIAGAVNHAVEMHRAGLAPEGRP